MTKRKQLGIKLTQLNWLLGLSSPLPLESKVLIYKTILKPIWTYGIQLWGASARTNVDIIQRFQSKTLRQIAKAPWYISNAHLHRDLAIPYVHEELSTYSTNYFNRLQNHPNELAAQMTETSHNTRRLRRRAPEDFI